jgi:hypothetical protein
MTSTIDDLATALCVPLTAAGIRAIEYLADQVNPPVAIAATTGVGYHDAFGVHGLAEHHFALMLILTRVGDRAGLKALEALMSNSGATSVRALVEADPTLGGVASACIVRRALPPVALSVSGVEYTSVTFDVDVYSE